jgi:hypothetical protein
LYISGFTEDAAVTAHVAGPNAAFLQKPFTLATLVKKAGEVLNIAPQGTER